MDADFSRGAEIQQSVPIIHWIGSGSLPPVTGTVFGTSPYPAQYLAAVRASIVGFIAHDDSLPRLTSSGRMFLDMLPAKVKDIDAPNRWQNLRPEDEGRADDWMERHFKMLKRAVNEAIPREQQGRKAVLQP